MTAYLQRTAALVAYLNRRKPAVLSSREAEVARLVAEGLTNRQIAERLVISERTAETTCGTSSPSWGSPREARSPRGACARGDEYLDE